MDAHRLAAKVIATLPLEPSPPRRKALRGLVALVMARATGRG
ncbi:hypothetical protein BH24ACT7_BH24ACT7_12610 [soil metagenome]